MSSGNIMVFSVPDSVLQKAASVGKIFGNPEDDARRVPSVEARVIILRVLNRAQQFKIGDEKMDTFSGVLLHFNATRSWWETSMDDGSGGNAPDCHSIDGIKPLASSPKKQSDFCNSCPRNRFETNEKGKKAKACADKIELFFYNPRFDLPVLMRASTMNRKPIVDFIEKCAELGIRKEMLIIRLSLFPTRNKGGVEYDGLKIEVVGTIETLADFRNKEEKTSKHTAASVAKEIFEFKAENEEIFNAYAYIGDANEVSVQESKEASDSVEEAGEPESGTNRRQDIYDPPF